MSDIFDKLVELDCAFIKEFGSKFPIKEIVIDRDVFERFILKLYRSDIAFGYANSLIPSETNEIVVNGIKVKRSVL